MKAISIKQPWASLICTPREDNPNLGIKDIENRTWKLPEKYKGQRVLIHASAKRWTFKSLVNYLTESMIFVLKPLGFNAEWALKLQTGVIIGSVELVDCVINHPSIWAEKTEVITDPDTGFMPAYGQKIYNWILANPILFPEPIPAKGQLRFWDYPDIDSCEDDLTGERICLCNIPVSEETQVMDLVGEYRCKYCGGKWYK